jgi:hypothetical protein
MGARLGQNGPGVQTFSATDRWLHRPVIMVFDTGSGGRALTETCQSMAGVFSPNLIDIYDRGGNASYRFVVCEHPDTTVAALVQQPDSRLWNEALAIATAKQLAVALSDLHRSGVETRGLHLGSIGIDGSGRVRLSPWPLADSPAPEDGSTAPTSELDLVAWVLESGAYPAGSRLSPTTAGLAARLRERSREGGALTLDQLRAALGRLEPSIYDRATGEVPAVTGAIATGAEAATGVVSAATTSSMVATGAVAATGIVATTTGAVAATGALAFGQDVQSHIYHRRRRRARWPLAAGVGVAGLVAFLAISLGSSNSPSPAAATTNGAGACVSTTKGCPTGAASQSPSTTTATTDPVTPITTPDAGSGVDVAASADPTTTTTTTEPSATTTTTTTTTEPSSSTTSTEPASTTTTTGVPSTTTTTTPPTPPGPSAPATP